MNVEELEKRVEQAKSRLDKVIKKRAKGGGTQKDWDEYESAYQALSLARQELAIIRAEEYVIPHPIGIHPSPSGSGEVVIQTADSTFVVFLANSSESCKDMGVAIVECVGCSLTKFGYPNDEGRKEHPLYDKGLDYFPGVGEVINSTWNAELQLQKETSARRIHGDRWDTYWKIFCSVENDQATMPVTKHFIFEFKDNVFECIALELKVRFSNKSYAKILSELNKVILSNQR